MLGLNSSFITNKIFCGKNSQLRPERWGELHEKFREKRFTHSVADDLTLYFTDEIEKDDRWRSSVDGFRKDGDNASLLKRLKGITSYINEDLKKRFEAQRLHGEKTPFDLRLNNIATPAFGADFLLGESGQDQKGFLAELGKAFHKNKLETENQKILVDKENEYNRLFVQKICSFDSAVSALNIQLKKLYGLSLVRSSSRVGESTGFRAYTLLEDEGNTVRSLAKVLVRTVEQKYDSDAPYFSQFLATKKFPDSALRLGVGFVSLNLKNTDALSAGEVLTLFHEVGHACENFLSASEVGQRPGPKIADDLKEMPSQLLEFLSNDREVVEVLANDEFNVSGEEVKYRLEGCLRDRYDYLGYDLVIHSGVLEMLSKVTARAPTFEDFWSCVEPKISEASKERMGSNEKIKLKIDAAFWLLQHIS